MPLQRAQSLVEVRELVHPPSDFCALVGDQITQLAGDSLAMAGRA